MKISVAICTFNRYELLHKAIVSASRQTINTDDYEIIVIDNSPSQSKSVDVSEKYRNISNLSWIYEPTPGLSRARNAAVEESSSDLIVFLDDDAIAVQEWLECYLDAFEILGGSTKVIGGRIRPIWESPRPSWLSDDLLGYLSVVDLGEETRLIDDTEWVAGANVAYRKSALIEAGAFDVSLGRKGSGASLMSNEEVELTKRIRASGGLVAYCPGATVDHLCESKRLEQVWFRRRMAWQAVSDFIGDPEKTAASAKASWSAVKEYLGSCPPSTRTLRGLALQEESAGRFRWQLSGIYHAVNAVLAGLDEKDA